MDNAIKNDVWQLQAAEYIRHASTILLAAGDPVDLPNLLAVFAQDGRSRHLVKARAGSQNEAVLAAVEYYDENLKKMHEMTFRSIQKTVEETFSEK